MSKNIPLIVLDGGLGTLLYSRGAFVKGDPLWSVRCLASPPESEARRQLYQAHLDYLMAGANIIKTNSYQMSPDHLRKCVAGLSQDDSMEMVRDSVRIARRACQDYWVSVGGKESGQKEPSVAGSIGPYGACQADMSEYTGNYVDSMSEEDFMEWHRPRLELLLETGVDYLAIETFPALMEAKAVLKLLHQVAPDVPAWISFSCKNGQELCHGETLISAVKEIWTNKTAGLKAIGINCTPERFVKPLLRSLNGFDVPVVLYPNRGMEGIPYPDSHEDDEADCRLPNLTKEWLNIHPNVFAVGGCCYYHPPDIKDLRHELQGE